jgi:hypothetical protein
VNSHFQPVSYSLYSGGGYCEGTAGYEVRLADSDIPATYQLFKNGAASGTPVAGTGQMLGFGLQPEGNYTISAVSGTCTADMQGVASNFIVTMPSVALTPSGPTEMCSGTQTTYQGSLPANGYTLFWELNPATAGIISQPTLTTAVINWDSNFSGAALLSVAGQNECGNGSASSPLIISVNGLPEPAVSGNNSTCVDKHDAYTTLYTSGSTYNWIVTGGEIITGQGTATIDVLWNTIGTGSVVVTETSVSDCEVTSAAYTVEVSACSDVAAEKITQLIVFPNPASDRIYLVLPASFAESCNISIISSDGRCVANYVNFKSGSEGWIDITDLKSGIYNLIINTNAVSAGASFIKK